MLVCLPLHLVQVPCNDLDMALPALTAKSYLSGLETCHTTLGYATASCAAPSLMFCAERSTDRQSGGSDSSDNMQPPSTPSSLQQQFAFAAGLAAAEDMPVAPPEPGEITQLSQVSSLTESKQLPAQQQQQQQQDEESGKQSSIQSAIQSEPESSSMERFDRQTNGQINGQSDGQTHAQASGQTDGQTNGQASGHASAQTDGQTCGQANGQTKLPEGQSTGQSNGQASMPQGQLPGKKSQQDVQLDPVQDAAQELFNQQQASISQPDQRDKFEAQRDMGATTTSAKRTSSSEASSSSSSSSNTAVGDDSSSAEAEVVEIEQMSFSERLQAGLDCFR